MIQHALRSGAWVLALAIAAHAPIGCTYASFGDNLSPNEGNGWIRADRTTPETARLSFKASAATLRVEYVQLSRFDVIGPVVPIVPLGSDTHSPGLTFKLDVDATAGAVTVDPRAVRFVNPCEPGVTRQPDGDIAFERAPTMTLFTRWKATATSPAGGKSERLQLADVKGPLTLKAEQWLTFSLNLAADRETIARCTLRFEGLLPGSGESVPDVLFERRPLREIGGL